MLKLGCKGGEKREDNVSAVGKLKWRWQCFDCQYLGFVSLYGASYARGGPRIPKNRGVCPDVLTRLRCHPSMSGDQGPGPPHAEYCQASTLKGTLGVEGR
jgi:hypothetical protein